jgi:DNA-binding transcriptional LysR family regulator
MDLHQLQAFEQIVLQGSFSKAARRLDISQPTISLRVHALEQEVGGALFIRGGSRLSLTELGRSFLPYAQAALRAMTRGVEVAQQTAQGKRGRVVIGTLPTLATGFFAAALERLHRLHPQLDIVVHTGHNQQILEMLYDSFVHIGCLTGPFFHPDMTVLLSIQEPLIMVAHASHPLAARSQVTLADLEAQGNPFFHIDWSLEAKHWQAQIATSNKALFEVPPQTAYDVIMRRTGVALLTRTMVRADLASGRLVEIAVQDMPAFQRACVLVRRKRDEQLPLAIDEFLSTLREESRV